ncbi:unnamed protein product [Amoebophrya sp. A25]|nr:unnamed protein product [Amoebophrya sp. A25]|eukprot:GSA25T00020816001.1
MASSREVLVQLGQGGEGQPTSSSSSVAPIMIGAEQAPVAPGVGNPAASGPSSSADDEAWRRSLQVGDIVEVYSQGRRTWISAEVVEPTAPGMVFGPYIGVRYLDGSGDGKNLAISNAKIRRPATQGRVVETGVVGVGEQVSSRAAVVLEVPAAPVGPPVPSTTAYPTDSSSGVQQESSQEKQKPTPAPTATSATPYQFRPDIRSVAAVAPPSSIGLEKPPGLSFPKLSAVEPQPIMPKPVRRTWALPQPTVDAQAVGRPKTTTVSPSAGGLVGGGGSVVGVGVATSVAPGGPGGVVSPINKGKELVPAGTSTTSSTTTTSENDSASSAAPSMRIDTRELEFRELLGSGGFGSVHRGVYKGEQVAIKKLFAASASDEKLFAALVAEFEKEVEVLQKLRHVRLVAIKGACVSRDHGLCMLLEYMPRGNLHNLLHVELRAFRPEYEGRDLQKCGLTPSTANLAALYMRERGKVVMHIAEGINFLHHGLTFPFLHRDLKSMNVVLDHELNAKLCDFGLTQSMEKTHVTRKEQEGGSPRYMAPELFDAAVKLTEKIDIWAVGCLAAEVFLRRAPHEECTNLQQVMAKLLVQKKSPFCTRDGLARLRPLALEDVVEECLRFEPKSRCSAASLLKRLTERLRL